jgi:opacity protein-like surface antigen
VNPLHVTTGALVLTATLGASTLAQAQEDRIDPLGGRVHGAQSPQHFAFEFRFSPYTPDIDSDPSLHGDTPYKNVFGTAPRFFIGAEFDWQALRIPHLGPLGPGVSIGYTTASDPAQFTTPHNGSTESGETTSLQILPLAALAVLRVDVLWRDVGIPLVPYAKVGVAYALWRASNTLGTSSFEGVSGKGHSFGTHIALGLALNLNPFDLYAAQNFDDSMGVNGTYLFAEWTREDYNGLGFQSDPLRVGGSNWMFGLAFEF